MSTSDGNLVLHCDNQGDTYNITSQQLPLDSHLTSDSSLHRTLFPYLFVITCRQHSRTNSQLIQVCIVKRQQLALLRDQEFCHGIRDMWQDTVLCIPCILQNSVKPFAMTCGQHVAAAQHMILCIIKRGTKLDMKSLPKCSLTCNCSDGVLISCSRLHQYCQY